MTGFLRFLGVTNAAIWLGATVFFTVAVGPAFFSDEMLKILDPPVFAGMAAQVVLKRYFLCLEICGAIALLHVMAEALYSGRAVNRGRVLLLAGILFLSVVGAHVIQPRLKALHLQKYAPTNTSEQQAAAGRSFGVWHGISQVMNLVVVVGVLFHLNQVTRSPDTFRYQIRF